LIVRKEWQRARVELRRIDDATHAVKEAVRLHTRVGGERNSNARGARRLTSRCRATIGRDAILTARPEARRVECQD